MGPGLGTDEMSLNDGELNVMNNNLKGELHEGKSQGQVTNYTGFFQNNISNDLLRKQNGSLQDENITIEGANRQLSNPSEYEQNSNARANNFAIQDPGDPYSRNLNHLISGVEYSDQKGKYQQSDLQKFLITLQSHFHLFEAI